MVAEPQRGLAVVDQTTGVLTRADEWNQRRVEFVRQHLCGGAPDAEASAFIEICKRRGLAPEEKQVYLIKRRTKDESGKFVDIWTPQTGIDGYRLMADRTGKYAGSDDPVFHDEAEFTTGKDDWKKQVIHPMAATVTVWKIVDGVRCPFSATARWREYYPGDKQGKFWHTMPYTMLGKCAEALALRKAFPADLSGIYTNEEMDQANRGEIVETTSTPVPAQSSAPKASAEQVEEIKALARQLGMTTNGQIKQRIGSDIRAIGPEDAQIAIDSMRTELSEIVESEANEYQGEENEIIDVESRELDGMPSDIADKYTS